MGDNFNEEAFSDENDAMISERITGLMERETGADGDAVVGVGDEVEVGVGSDVIGVDVEDTVDAGEDDVFSTSVELSFSTKISILTTVSSSRKTVGEKNF